MHDRFSYKSFGVSIQLAVKLLFFKCYLLQYSNIASSWNIPNMVLAGIVVYTLDWLFCGEI
jgi:hypothetical protein